MDTTQQASDFLKQENMAFWQLWKGTSKVSECEKDNNPTADPATAQEHFKNVLELLPPNSYRLSVYRNASGQRSANNFEFTKAGAAAQQAGGLSSVSSLREQMRAELMQEFRMKEMEDKIKKLEENQNKLFEILEDLTDGDGNNDFAQSLIKEFALGAIKNKTAAPVVINQIPRASGGFNNL
ncbi:hypothetical protein [Salmonirosea aquatica]|uniref:Uncharacterized protein n=2 Tax=Salmonirosea aquatica TaxID=2654236 RepID=A0A7C9FZM9_9BACT|nr:hypothetical protein [Cytophagaceae bacterium SJW1-29]MPR37153.1 hypothetical protein [Cytophagaceae bacterium SJW1-29]